MSDIMAAMTVVAWERADESRGFSIARRERLDDGWRFVARRC